MPNFTDQIAAIDSELAALLTPVESEPEPQVITMTPEELASYAKNQLELAKADTDPTARLTALHEVIALAKAYSWEEKGSMGVSVYGGPLSVGAQSASGEESEKSVSVPGPQASPGAQGFEASGGDMSGPAPTAAARAMPPAFPVSPAASGQGWISKAEVEAVIAKADNADALAAAMKDLLSQPVEGDITIEQEPEAVAKDDAHWPADLASKQFLDGEKVTDDVIDFGDDPDGLGRGKIVGE